MCIIISLSVIHSMIILERWGGLQCIGLGQQLYVMQIKGRPKLVWTSRSLNLCLACLYNIIIGGLLLIVGGGGGGGGGGGSVMHCKCVNM